MREYGIKAFLAAFLAILLCGIMTYSFMNAQEFATAGGYPVTRGEVAEINAILAARYKEGATDLESLARQIKKLQEYAQILRQVEEKNQVVQYGGLIYSKKQTEEVLSRYDLSVEQAQRQVKLLSIVLERIQYAGSYAGYIQAVHQNVKDMLDVNFFNKTLRSQIMKAEKDFYGLEHVEISPVLDVGLGKLFESRIGSVIGLTFGLLCAGGFVGSCVSGVKKDPLSQYSLWRAALPVYLGAVGIFLAEAVAADRSWSVGELGRSIQSVTPFQSSPYFLSVGALLAIRIAFQSLAVLMGFLLAAGVLFLFHRRKRMALLLTVLLGLWAVTDCIFYARGALFTQRMLYHTENIWGKYGNVYVFGWPVSSGVILVIAAAVWVLLCGLFASGQEKTMLVEVRRQAEQKYFQEVDAKYTQTRLLRHDIHNHLAAVAVLLKEGKTRDAEKYLGELLDYFDATKPPVRTGVNVLDAVLLSKDSRARELGIKLEMDFLQGVNSFDLSDYELCSLFGNLLDNSIAACEKLEPDKRYIRLKVSSQMEMLCVFCENPYQGLQRENGQFVSQKADRMNHGMGLGQIKRIAEAHNGMLEIDTKDGVFSVSVLLGGKADDGPEHFRKGRAEKKRLKKNDREKKG